MGVNRIDVFGRCLVLLIMSKLVDELLKGHNMANLDFSLEDVRAVVREGINSIKDEIGVVKADINKVKADIGIVIIELGTVKREIRRLNSRLADFEDEEFRAVADRIDLLEKRLNQTRAELREHLCRHLSPRWLAAKSLELVSSTAK
jgi:hypothetical protein